MKDRVFGEIDFNEYWIKIEKINMYGKENKVQLIIDEEEISDNHRDAYINLKKKERILVKKIEVAIYEYYMKVYKSYREMLKDEADKFAPIISGPIEMCSLVKITHIMIGRLYDEKEIDFLFECSWDMEEGIGIRMVEDKIIEIGSQDIVL